MFRLFFTLFIGIFVVDACLSKKKDSYKVSPEFPYDLLAPSQKYALPNQLKEISGLSFLNGHQLACIQDEEAIVFIFDLNLKKVVQEINFGKSGDYEGIEIVKDTVFVVKSNGHLLYFPLNDPSQLQEVNTPFNKKNDVEGLSFSYHNNALIFACKEKGEVGGNEVKGKAFYQFSLKDFTLAAHPFLVLKKNELNLKKFKPSAVAFHPATNELFILSSKEPALVVVKDSKVVYKIGLDPQIFEQPEGICFAPDGTMFISSEGKTGEGYVLSFQSK